MRLEPRTGQYSPPLHVLMLKEYLHRPTESGRGEVFMHKLPFHTLEGSEDLLDSGGMDRHQQASYQMQTL